MRVLVALGGNALLEARRTDDRRRTAGQHPHRRRARWPPSPSSTSWCCRTATVPQVGLLALQAAAYKDVEPYPARRARRARRRA